MTTQVKELFKITALSNLHAGSGDQNYGIVDKLVQRDPLTQFPIIHASSLKGALKKYCESNVGFEKDDIRNSFGDDDGYQGQDKYFSAHLFTIPVRSNLKPYFRATCPAILKEIVELLVTFGVTSDPQLIAELKQLSELPFETGEQFIVFDDSVKDCLIEEYYLGEANSSNKKGKFTDNLIKILKYNIAEIKKDDFIIVRNDVFMDICDNLPVVARNRLDTKKNLWYEELVPRQAEFFFFYVGSDVNRTAILDKIADKSKKEMPVQIGANASVGYGFCKIDKISKS